MATRRQGVAAFNDTESAGLDWRRAWHKDPKTAQVKTDMSKRHMSGTDDPLHAALSAKTPVLPRDEHTWTHSARIQPRGAHYHPAGEFGSRHRTGAGRSVYSYGGNRHSAVPGNAIGSPPNRRGGNAVGSPPNRIGENALASRFVPRGGGGHKP